MYVHTHVHRLHQLPHLPRDHRSFHLLYRGKEKLFSWRIMSKIITKAHCYISSMPNHSPQRALSVYERVVKQTLIRVYWDEKLEAYAEKQERQTVHMGRPIPGVAKGSPGKQHATLGLYTSSKVIPAISNFPKTYDCLWQSVLPVTQQSIWA